MDNVELVENKDTLWKEYKLHIELFNSYLTTCLMINIFYYTFAGAMLSIFFTHHKSQFIFILVFLFLLGIFFLGVFYQTKSKIGIYGDYITYAAKKLDLRFVHIKPKTLIATANTVTYIMFGNLACLFILFVYTVYG